MTKSCILAILFFALNTFATFFPSNTPAPLATPVITGLTVTRFTMTVIWSEAGNAQSGDWQNGYYTVSYGTSPGVVTRFMSTNNSLALSEIFTGLTPGTNYYIWVQYFVPSLNLQSPVSNTANIATWP
jgi:hypothetical protein